MLVTLKSILSHTSYDPFLLVHAVLSKTTDPYVETAIIRTLCQHDTSAPFGQHADEFGPAMRIPSGEVLYMRARAHCNGAPVTPRLFHELEPGETREVTFVVATPGRTQATCTIVLAWRPDRPYDKNPAIEDEGAVRYSLHRQKTSSMGVYAMNVLPCVLLDRPHNPKLGLLAIDNSTAIVNGAIAAMVGRADGEDVWKYSARGVGLLTLSEWAANVKKLEKREPLMTISFVSEAKLRASLEKTRVKIEKTVAATIEANAHAHITEIYDTVRSFDEARTVAQRILEVGTLGGLVDGIACGRFRGIRIASFEMPDCIPLYICTCLLIAANPRLVQLATSPEALREDGAASDMLMRQYRSTSTGVQGDTGTPSTTLETLIEVAAWDTRDVQRHRRSAARNASGGCTDEHSRELESMRWRGAMLLQEFFGIPSSGVVNTNDHRGDRHLGSQPHREACETIVHYTKVPYHTMAHQSGAHGCMGFDQANHGRLATRAQAQTVILTMLFEVNSFCESGAFRGEQLCERNTAMEDAMSNPGTGIISNARACTAISLALANFFTAGINTFFTNSDIPLVYPLRPQTRVPCGACGCDYDPRMMAFQCQFVRCLKCSRGFCTQCYPGVVTKLYSKTSAWPPDTNVLAQHPNALRCRKCGGM
jgi:hypothetical protein